MNTQRFADKLVAVTGSGRGIGKNIAKMFGQEGARVVICDIDEESGRQTESELRGEGLSSEYLPVDLSQPDAPQSMVREIVRRNGRLDCLVNNARAGRRVEMLDEDEETWQTGISVTLRAAFMASQEAVRVMSATGGGSIVSIASITGLVAGHESPVYHIAKAGMIQMTRYLAAHAGRMGIRVNCVLPGFIVQDEHRSRYDRDDNRQYREISELCHPMGKVGSSDDVANAVLFLCSPEAAYVNGHALVVDGGVSVQEQFSLMYYKFHRKQ